MIDTLLDYGADINLSGEKIFPVIYSAVVEKNAEMLKYLIAKGADLGVRFDLTG